MLAANRREFLAWVSGGALLAAPGSALAASLRFDDQQTLTFGTLEPLVRRMQETPADELVAELVGEWRAGLALREIVSAAALANARTFGGHDYEGYHAAMALLPAHAMAGALPETEAALPVLKVVHRNTRRMQSVRPRGSMLGVVEASADRSTEGMGGAQLHAAMVERNVESAERTLAALCDADPALAFEALLYLIQENVDVHRVVLAWRAWDIQRLTGPEHASTLLRQCVRFCLDAEASRVRAGREAPLRRLLPELLADHGLPAKATGAKTASDEWVLALADTVFAKPREEAARAVAAALADGHRHEDVGEALSLAANRLLLFDPGRSESQVRPGKPVGSVHGASVGVHASDSANAWRHLARMASPRHAAGCLIAGAYHTAGQSHHSPEDFVEAQGALADVERLTKQEELLAACDEAIQAGDQAHAAACTRRAGRREGGDPEAWLELGLRHSIAADGALHAEKYYLTAGEEQAAARPAFRWRHLEGLARVCASQHGWPAPGVAEIRELLRS